MHSTRHDTIHERISSSNGKLIEVLVSIACNLLSLPTGHFLLNLNVVNVTWKIRTKLCNWLHKKANEKMTVLKYVLAR
jgi:hypothetical protein